MRLVTTIIGLNGWIWAIIVYVTFVLLTFMPVLTALFKRVKLNPGGSSFDDSPYFSPQAKARLNQHYSRILGTLGFWKNQAAAYKRFHYYCLCWSIPVSVLIPVITQWVGTTPSKVFLTIMSSHVAILLAFNRGLKVENHYKAFRQGESEFYDLYRRLLDDPERFGTTEDEQLLSYFQQAEVIRKYVRNAETDNFPTIDDIQQMIDKQKIMKENLGSLSKTK